MGKRKSNKTTPQHFVAFKKEFLFWVTRFGLQDWEIGFEHHRLDDLRASINYTYSGKCAVAILTSEWTDTVTPLNMKEIKFVARHEAIHLLIADLATLGASRYVTEDEMTETRESLVRRLEKVL